MMYVVSHGYTFKVETENSHGEDLTSDAVKSVKNFLDGLDSETVSKIHTNLENYKNGVDEEMCNEAHDVCAFAEQVSAYEDFVVNLQSS